MKKLIEMLEKLGEDVVYDINDKRKEISIDFNDFNGFNDDWSEDMRDFDNPELVNELLNYLDEHATAQQGDLYSLYSLDGYTITVGYTSYEI